MWPLNRADRNNKTIEQSNNMATKSRGGREVKFMCGSRDVLVPLPEISRCQEISKVLMHLYRATVNVLPLVDMLIADVHN